jgi:hypothetical protein
LSAQFINEFNLKDKKVSTYSHGGTILGDIEENWIVREQGRGKVVKTLVPIGIRSINHRLQQANIENDRWK